MKIRLIIVGQNATLNSVFSSAVNRYEGSNRSCFPLAPIINVFTRRYYASRRHTPNDLEYARQDVKLNKKLREFLYTNAVSNYVIN